MYVVICFGKIIKPCPLAGTGENIVKQIVVSGCRSERVGGRTLFSPELVYAQIYEVFIWKYGKNRLIHRRHLAIV